MHKKDSATSRDTVPGRRGHGTTPPTGMTAARGRSSRQGGDSCAGSGLRQTTRAPNPPCLTNAAGSTEEEGAPRPSPSPWSWQTQNCPASALSPGWGDPICPCSGQLDPAPGPHLGGSPHAVGVGCSIAGRRHPAASLPPPPRPPSQSSQENGPLCGSQAHCVGPASRWGPRCARHAEPGTAPNPRLDTHVFRLAHVCAPGSQGKVCCDPGPPATLARDHVLPVLAHLPSHSCWDNGRVAKVTGCSDWQLWTPSSLRRCLRAAAAQPPPGARPRYATH